MGGLASRRKGRTAEYEVRDYFKEIGWVANRVPLSGASQGYKGDVSLSKDDIYLTCEVKSRKSEFKSIYDKITQSKSPLRLSSNGELVTLSYSFNDLGFEGTKPMLFDNVERTRTINKIFNLQKLLKGCDFLVIKIDRRPLIFIRFFGKKE